MYVTYDLYLFYFSCPSLIIPGSIATKANKNLFLDVLIIGFVFLLFLDINENLIPKDLNIFNISTLVTPLSFSDKLSMAFSFYK